MLVREIVNKVYDGNIWNPGHKKRKMLKLVNGNILDVNVCNLDCNCGWNISIGGRNLSVLYKIIKLLEED